MPPTAIDNAGNPEPQHAFTISLNHIMERFTSEGIGRTKRRLAELCQKGTLDGRKFKTTHGDTWFVTAASLEAAIQQIKSEESLAAAAGASMLEHASAGDSQRPAMASAPSDANTNHHAADIRVAHEDTQPDHANAGGSRVQQASAGSDRVEQGNDLAVYEHPYVKKLEAKVEKLEDTLNDTHVAHRRELMKLQEANLVALSQNFGQYMMQMLGMKAIPGHVEDTRTETESGTTGVAS